jgi:hypothetical protein
LKSLPWGRAGEARGKAGHRNYEERKGPYRHTRRAERKAGFGKAEKG